MSRRAQSVVVVGGGVIGAMSAYYLSRTGLHVTVVDQGQFGRGCSHANCGLVCPSHVLPLAEPGAVGQAVRAMFQRNAPLSIKPRLDLALWSWLLRFAQHCSHEQMIDAAQAIQAMLDSSMQLYKELAQSEPLDCEWEAKGLVFAYCSTREFDRYAKTDKLLAANFHLPAERISGSALEALEPALRPGLAGAWHYHDDAHLRPDKLMTGLRNLLEARGVAILEFCDVRDFRAERGQALAAVAPGRELAADAFVVAAGALAPKLAKALGCSIPIQPGKGYSITMPRPASCPSVPLIFPETRVAVTPFRSGYRLGSTMEFAGYDTTLNRSRLQLLRDGAAPYLREPYCEPVEEEWYGWRPMTYDGKPIIDRCPAMPNVIVAAGHNMLGLSMAPATGKLVAELLTGEEPHVSLGPYSLGRF